MVCVEYCFQSIFHVICFKYDMFSKFTYALLDSDFRHLTSGSEPWQLAVAPREELYYI